MVGITADVLKHKSLMHVAIHNDGVHGTFRSISYLDCFGFKSQDGGQLY
jgi:hypothetical protein